MSDGGSTLTAEAMIEQANRHGFPNVRVMCDLHRPMKHPVKEWQECRRPECQQTMARRREAVRKAGAVTEAEKAGWSKARKGLAVQVKG